MYKNTSRNMQRRAESIPVASQTDKFYQDMSDTERKAFLLKRLNEVNLAQAIQSKGTPKYRELQRAREVLERELSTMKKKNAPKLAGYPEKSTRRPPNHQAKLKKRYHSLPGAFLAAAKQILPDDSYATIMAMAKGLMHPDREIPPPPPATMPEASDLVEAVARLQEKWQ